MTIALPLVGPSYQIRATKADVQRTVGWMPALVESGAGKGGAVGYLKQQPGLKWAATLTGEGRGLFEYGGFLYAVVGSTLYRIDSSMAATSLGTVSGSGLVGMSANKTQIAIATGGLAAYVLDVESGAMNLAPSPADVASSISVLDGYGVFAVPDSAQFYVTASENFNSVDPLDFASAEGTPGNIIGHIVRHREVIFLKENTGEVWYDSGGADFPLVRNDGANIEVGLLASRSLCKLGGVAYWVGREPGGGSVVFGMGAYTPTRISSAKVEEDLAKLGDVSGAWAYTYHQEGLAFYVLNAPGWSTTWVYEVASGVWHERAEFPNGAYAPWRARCHAYAYGKHYVLDEAGGLYELDPYTNTNDGDTLIRDRITPHQAVPALSRQRFGSIQVDCEVGVGLPDSTNASLLLRTSDDGGKTWGSWRTLTLGHLGQHMARARATMLGSSRDRVWHIRCTDDVTANLVNAVIDAK